jgi:hypothetical protein
MLAYFTLIGILTAAITDSATAAPLQLLTEFEVSPSMVAIQEMQREMDRLYRDVPVAIAWHGVSNFQSPGRVPRLLFVHFKGDCRAVTMPPRHGVEGVALASVNRVDGEMLPLVTVDCQRIANYIWPSLRGPERSHGDKPFGRALARVLAHELYHYLTGEAKHTHSALFRASISSSALLSSQFRLGADEIEDLRRALPDHLPALRTI